MSTHIFSSKSALSISALAVVAILDAKGDVPFSFSSDFSTLAPSSSLFGAAQLDSGILKLTEPINSSFGVYSIGLPSDRTFQTLHAGWKSLIGGGDVGGADGYSFNVATDLPNPPTYGNPGEEGAGSGLSVTVDTFDNGGGEVGLEIKWKGAQVAFQAVPKDDDGSGNFLRKDQFVDASVDVSPNGVVIFSYDGNVLSAALPSFSGLNANTFMFGARTGGANDRHWIDNLTINANGAVPVPDASSTSFLVALVSAGLISLRRFAER